MFLLNGMRFPNEKVYYAFNRMDRMEMVTLMKKYITRLIDKLLKWDEWRNQY